MVAKRLVTRLEKLILSYWKTLSVLQVVFMVAHPEFNSDRAGYSVPELK